MILRSFAGIVAACMICTGCGQKVADEVPKKAVEKTVTQDGVKSDAAASPAGETSSGNKVTTGMAGVEQDALAAARAAAKGVLAAALATCPENNYSPAKWKTLTRFKSAGDKAIDSATDIAGVTAAQTTATTGMAGVEKNALSAAKASAKSVLAMALATYTDGNYSSASWATLTGFKSAGDTGIDAATNLTGVTSVQNTATAGMAGVEKDALASARVAAKGALATALATYTESNTSPANWKILTGFKAAGDKAIDAATDVAGVSSAQNIATIGMAGVEKDALAAAKVTAKGVLAAALATYAGGNYSSANWATLTGFKATGDAAIDAATDLTGVTFAQNNATLRMGVVEKDALTAARVAAKGVLTAALAAYLENNYSPEKWKALAGFKSAGDAAIDAATDLAGVTAAQNAGTLRMAEVEGDALAAAKATAKGVLVKALATYTESNYSPANWRTLTGFKSAGDTAIDGAGDLAGVTTPQTTATNGMAGVDRDALAAAKVAAKAVLAAALASYTESNYSPANWATLTGFKAAGDAAIDAATDLAGVTAALNAGLGRKK